MDHVAGGVTLIRVSFPLDPRIRPAGQPLREYIGNRYAFWYSAVVCGLAVVVDMDGCGHTYID